MLCCDTDTPMVSMTLTVVHFTVFDDLCQEVATDTTLQALRDSIVAGQQCAPWAAHDGLITFKGRVYISPTSPSLPIVLVVVHNTGHEGVQKTLHRLRANFHVPNARTVVQDHVRTCPMCQ